LKLFKLNETEQLINMLKGKLVACYSLMRNDQQFKVSKNSPYFIEQDASLGTMHKLIITFHFQLTAQNT